VNSESDIGFPPRPAGKVKTLILASQLFPVLEHMVLDAKREAYFGFRVFDPDTRLRSNAALGRGLETWGDLIADALCREVQVRILLTDFPPIMATALHQMTWKAVNAWQAAAQASGEIERFQIIAALHEGEASPLIRHIYWPLVRLKLERHLRNARDDGAKEQALKRDTPGIWGLLKGRGQDLSADLWAPRRLFPATYHQKCAVFDGEVALVGGLDVDERRFDDPQHARPAQETWHDVSVAFDGPAAADVRAHFVSCWNRETPRFNARLTALGAPRAGLPGTTAPVDVHPLSDTTAEDGQPSLRVIRTRSRRSRSVFAFGPEPHLCEIESAIIELAERSSRLLYIETQFFRSRRVAEALVARARSNRGLKLILVLPAAPEGIAFEGKDGPDSRHGEWLQVRALDILQEGFADRLAVFSLVKDGVDPDSDSRATVSGRPIIYVHAKVAIADGQCAIVSSANLNNRSLRWDTELGVVWEDSQQVRKFQDRLWSVHLRDAFDGEVDPTSDAALGMWRRAAGNHCGNAHGRADPLITHYPIATARAFARRWRFIPENLL